LVFGLRFLVAIAIATVAAVGLPVFRSLAWFFSSAKAQPGLPRFLVINESGKEINFPLTLTLSPDGGEGIKVELL
jgi:hypothetical protein